MSIMTPLATKAQKRMAAIRNEADFWSAFVELSREFLAWPNGLLMLWTPTVPYSIFEFQKQVPTLVRSHGDESVDTGMTSPIFPDEMGRLRRDVRSGQWLLSWRDTNRHWHVLHDARDLHVRFTDAMQRQEDLGIAA